MEFNAGVFKEKAGPLPVWMWSLLVGGVAYYVYTKKKSSSAADTSSTDTVGTSATDYSPAIISADYDLANRLGVLSGQVGGNTAAVTANTAAEARETPTATDTSGEFAVVSYNGWIDELGKSTGVHLSPGNFKKTGGKTQKGALFVDFMGSIYQLGSSKPGHTPGPPKHLTPSEYNKLGKPRTVKVMPNTKIRIEGAS